MLALGTEIGVRDIQRASIVDEENNIKRCADTETESAVDINSDINRKVESVQEQLDDIYRE